MKTKEIIEQLLVIYYRTYQDSEVNRKYGIQAKSLTDNAGVRFDNEEEALAAMEQMKDKGWIINLNDTPAQQIENWHKVQLTEEGLSYAEELSKPVFIRCPQATYAALRKGIAKGPEK